MVIVAIDNGNTSVSSIPAIGESVSTFAINDTGDNNAIIIIGNIAGIISVNDNGDQSGSISSINDNENNSIIDIDISVSISASVDIGNLMI